MTTNKVHFPSINGIRFIAACAVLFSHLLDRRAWDKPEHVWYRPYTDHFGYVLFYGFFQISSFLITYLLLTEQLKTGKIDLKKFYIRRIFRIWPLYYLIIIISFFVLPHFDILRTHGYPQAFYHNFYLGLFFCVIILPNIGVKLCPNLFATPTWTLGVEEPFYLIWPLVVRKSRNLLRLLIIAEICCILGTVIVTCLKYKYGNNNTVLVIHYLWTSYSGSYFATGGIMACLCFYKKQKVLNVIYNKYFRISVYTIGAVVLLSNVVFPLYYEFFSFVSAVGILNMATNKKTMISLDNKLFNYLGGITYGFYMYHVIIIIIVYRYVTGYNNFIMGLLIYIITTIVAILSYEFFESKFLRIKKRYAVIQNSDK